MGRGGEKEVSLFKSFSFRLLKKSFLIKNVRYRIILVGSTLALVQQMCMKHQ